MIGSTFLFIWIDWQIMEEVKTGQKQIIANEEGPNLNEKETSKSKFWQNNTRHMVSG